MAPISVQQRILCLALTLVCCLIVLLHSSNYFDHSNHHPALHATTRETDDTVGEIGGSASSSSSSESRCFAILPDLRNDPPFTAPFRPPEIEAELKKLAGTASADAAAASATAGDNSVLPTEEEIQLARDNWVRPFRKMDTLSSHSRVVAQYQLWSRLSDYVAKRAGSNAPVVLFLQLGEARPSSAPPALALFANLPALYHDAHENATVLVVDPHHRHSPPRSESTNSRRTGSRGQRRHPRLLRFAPPAGADSASSSTSSAAWLLGTGSPKNSFGTFFQTCNFVAQTFILPATLDAEYRRVHVVPSILAALPMSSHVFALVTPQELALVQSQLANERRKQKLLVETDKLLCLTAAVKRTASASSPFCDEAATTTSASSSASPSAACGELQLVVFRVLEAERACSKTWGAPLVQWGRKLIASRSVQAGIRFRVEAVGDGGKGTGRHVHPLQYIPSVNLDTLLGAGLEAAARQRLLADMVATPRYSDPLPHNWVVGRGARAIRIDRVDRRYDRDVDETKGYWGVSTRGYMHLLGHHLCLPIDAAQGVPSVMTHTSSSSSRSSIIGEGASDCSHSCVSRCVAQCSYTEKGATPCAACLECADCIRHRAATDDDHGEENTLHCHVEYPSMHAARKIWAKWKKADTKNGHTP